MDLTVLTVVVVRDADLMRHWRKGFVSHGWQMRGRASRSTSVFLGSSRWLLIEHTSVTAYRQDTKAFDKQTKLSNYDRLKAWIYKNLEKPTALSHFTLESSSLYSMIRFVGGNPDSQNGWIESWWCYEEEPWHWELEDVSDWEQTLPNFICSVVEFYIKKRSQEEGTIRYY